MWVRLQIHKIGVITAAISAAFAMSACQDAAFTSIPSPSVSQTDASSTGTPPGGSPGSNGGGSSTVNTISQQYFFGIGVSLFNPDGTANQQAKTQCQANIAATIPNIVSTHNDGASITATCVFPDQTLAKMGTESEWLDYVINAFVNYPPPGAMAGVGPVFTFMDKRSQTQAACQAEQNLLGGGTPFQVFPQYYLMTAKNVTMSCVANNMGGYNLTITVDTSQYEKM